MNVICGVNGETWQEVELFMCHHCGMPVCIRDGVTIAADDAFYTSQVPVPRAAMHCPTCADDYHRGAARYHGWLDQKASGGRGAPAAEGIPAWQGQQVRARAAGGQ